MNKRKFLELINDVPDDYNFELSEYLILDKSEGEEYIAVHDIPIRGIAVNDESKELRFICDSSDKEALQTLGEKVKEI